MSVRYVPTGGRLLFKTEGVNLRRDLKLLQEHVHEVFVGVV